jgi:hypothetical protein
MEILDEREKTHGDFAKVANASNQIRGVLIQGADKHSAVQAEALTMIATKLARIVCGDPDERDHWEDIAGYAQLVVRDLRRQQIADMCPSDALNVPAQLHPLEAKWREPT